MDKFLNYEQIIDKIFWLGYNKRDFYYIIM